MILNFFFLLPLSTFENVRGDGTNFKMSNAVASVASAPSVSRPLSADKPEEPRMTKRQKKRVFERARKRYKVSYFYVHLIEGSEDYVDTITSSRCCLSPCLLAWVHAIIFESTGLSAQMHLLHLTLGAHLGAHQA
ncbi:unnamed protein product [Penicillium olsonii]|nr:unnamed protein product [Penicillium olsonii]